MNELLAQSGPAFTEWQRSLAMRPRELFTEAVRAAHAERQHLLIGALDEGSVALTRYLRERLRLDPGVSIGAPRLPREALTPSEFREAPAELEVELAEAWSDRISPADASKPLFWLLCHIEWIEQARFGEDQMRAYFMEGGGRGDEPDAQTRTFLRRTGGLPHVRGNVSVLTDCPLARAWWRVRVATEVAEDLDASLTRAEAHEVLRAPGQVWTEIAQMGLQRTTAINQPRARAALVAALAEGGEPDRAAARSSAQALARAASTRSLAHIPWPELRSIASAASTVESLA